MRALLRASVLMAAALAQGEARACMIADAQTALIHNGIPDDIDPRLLVARVDIEWALPEALYEQGASARVTRIVQGRYDGDLLILRSAETDCSRPFKNGTSGLIVGIPIGFENGVLVLEALEVNAVGGYRLPDRYRVPEEYMRSGRLRHRGQ